MSNPAFFESVSTDPIERAIARKVVRILNDRTLDRAQRERLVRQAQQDLRSHQRDQQCQRDLLALVAAIKLPAGHHAQMVQVQEGKIQLGVVNAKKAFTWIDVGAAPAGLTRTKALALPHRVGPGHRAPHGEQAKAVVRTQAS